MPSICFLRKLLFEKQSLSHFYRIGTNEMVWIGTCRASDVEIAEQSALICLDVRVGSTRPTCQYVYLKATKIIKHSQIDLPTDAV